MAVRAPGLVSLTLLVTLTLMLLGHVMLTEALIGQSDSCRIHWVAHMLRVPGCRDKRLLSLACKGRCMSHSVYMPEKDDVHRTCNCCQATGSTVRRVRMTCFDSVTRRYRPRVIQVALPTGCMCRPCSAINDRVPDVVNPVEDRTISDYFAV